MEHLESNCCAVHASSQCCYMRHVAWLMQGSYVSYCDGPQRLWSVWSGYTARRSCSHATLACRGWCLYMFLSADSSFYFMSLRGVHVHSRMCTCLYMCTALQYSCADKVISYVFTCQPCTSTWLSNSLNDTLIHRESYGVLPVPTSLNWLRAAVAGPPATPMGAHRLPLHEHIILISNWWSRNKADNLGAFPPDFPPIWQALAPAEDALQWRAGCVETAP
jgi:hypothetical protein